MGIQKDECQERIHIRNTYYVMKTNGTQRILILFLTHANFSTHTNILLTCATHAKVLWTHATNAAHVTYASFLTQANIYEPTPPTPKFDQRHPRTHATHPRHLADSNAERKRVFKSQLTCCKENSFNRGLSLTMNYFI